MLAKRVTKAKLTNSEGTAVGAEAFSSDLMPGRQVLLHYSDDKGIWHAARLLYPAKEGCWYMLTPDGDIYAKDVTCSTGEGPSQAAL